MAQPLKSPRSNAGSKRRMG